MPAGRAVEERPISLGLRTYKAAIYDTLTRMISELELLPGTRLVEADLAERFQMSKTPIREALLLLEADGLVKLEPYQGATVTWLSLDEYEELLFIQDALEQPSLARVAERMLRRERTISHDSSGGSSETGGTTTAARSSRTAPCSTSGSSAWPDEPRLVRVVMSLHHPAGSALSAGLHPPVRRRLGYRAGDHPKDRFEGISATAIRQPPQPCVARDGGDAGTGPQSSRPSG